MTAADRLLGQIAGVAVAAVIVVSVDWPVEIATGVGVLAGALTVFLITTLILRDRV